MMRNVVEEGDGSGRQSRRPHRSGQDGHRIDRATGSNLTEPWFVGFAPVQSPRIVVAVTIDKTQGGYGGTVAAPIAAAVMKLLLSEQNG